MAELYRCDPPGAIEFLDSRILRLFLGQNAIFRQKKAKNFFGPKMVRKWPKSGQKWPKLPQNRRNNWRGSPRKSQRIPKISEKWPKTLLQCNMKMHQKRTNGQKSATRGQTRTLDSSQRDSMWSFCRVYSLCQWAGAILRSFWGPF